MPIESKGTQEFLREQTGERGQRLREKKKSLLEQVIGGLTEEEKREKGGKRVARWRPV